MGASMHREMDGVRLCIVPGLPTQLVQELNIGTLLMKITSEANNMTRVVGLVSILHLSKIIMNNI